MKIKIRFIGQFFLDFDDTATPKTAKVYLRASDCHGMHPHVPIISFNPKFFGKSDFDPKDRLHVSITGESLASREIPPNSVLAFSGLAGPSMEIERSKDATAKDVEDLKIDLLPSLTDGGASRLKTPVEIGILSSLMVDFASVGRLSCERVFRDAAQEPLEWGFFDGLTQPNPSKKQAIAEVLTWVAELTTLDATLMLNGVDWLKVASSSSPVIELIISNLPTVPLTPSDTTLVDFPRLLDYSVVSGTRLTPKLLDTTSTGGSVICPGARP